MSGDGAAGFSAGEAAGGGDMIGKSGHRAPSGKVQITADLRGVNADQEIAEMPKIMEIERRFAERYAHRRDVACYVSTAGFVARVKIGVAQ